MKKIISLSLVCISLLSAQTDIIFSNNAQKISDFVTPQNSININTNIEMVCK